MSVGGQLGIEHKFSRKLPGVFFPELHKAQDLTRPLGLGNSRIRVAENPFCRVTGQEHKNSFLAPAPAGNVVFLERFFLGVSGNGMKVEIDRGTPLEACPLHLLKPGTHELKVGLMGDPGTVSGKVGAFRHDIEPGKQGDPLIEDEVHHVTLPFLADQLQCQEATNGLLRRNHPRSRKIDLVHNTIQVNVFHQRHEQEQATDACVKGTGGQIDSFDVSYGRRLWFHRDGTFIVAASGQTGKALFAHEDGKGVDADLVTGGS